MDRWLADGSLIPSGSGYVRGLRKNRELYHRLFADLLRKRLVQRFDRVLVTGLHKSASNWHQKNGSISESVDHALAAKDFEQAAGLAEEFAMTMFITGECVTLLGWMKRLPESFIRIRAWLCIYYAWALIFTGQLEPIESLLCIAEELIQCSSGKVDPPDILGNIAVIRARVAARNDDLPRALDLAQMASALLPKGNLMARSAAEFVKGEAYFEEGSLMQALEGFLHAKSLGEAADKRNYLLWLFGEASIQNMPAGCWLPSLIRRSRWWGGWEFGIKIST
jgi:LuxR family maltose regulon positive regulatory protein